MSSSTSGANGHPASPDSRPVLLTASMIPPYHRPPNLDRDVLRARRDQLIDQITWSRFPSPLFLSRSAYHSIIASKLVMIEAALERSLHDYERDHLVEILALSARTSSYSVPIAQLTAVFMTWRGSRTLRFPFITPNPNIFNVNVLPTRGRPLLTGRGVPWIWHAARLAAYYTTSSIAFVPIFAYMGEYRAAKRLFATPDLAGVRREAIANAKKYFPRARFVGDSSQPVTSPQTGQPTETPSWIPSPAPPSDRGPVDWAPDQERRPTLYPPQTSKPTARESQGDYENVVGSGIFGDDASPVAPSYRSAPQPTEPAGSSWERLRMQGRRNDEGKRTGAGQVSSWAALRDRAFQDQAMKGNSPETHQDDRRSSPRQGGSGPDTREQAQKEFDALLEAERRGSSDRS